MPLTVTRKKELVTEITEKLKESELCLLADPIGMTVAQVDELRTKLRESNIDYKIYKNTLISRALDETGDEKLQALKDSLIGPTGVAVTPDDPIVAAKVFVDFQKDNDKLTLKAAVYQGEFWDAAKIKSMSELGSMASIYGQLVSAMQAPAFKLTHALRSPAQNLVLTLKAIAEKGNK